MRAALDTNILVYAEGLNDALRQRQARKLLAQLPPDSAVVPATVIVELFHALTRQARRSRAAAHLAILDWLGPLVVAPLTVTATLSAMDLADRHQLQIWDAAVLAVAAEAGCEVLLSEDLQPGFTWGGVTVVNPFAPDPHPLLSGLLP